MNFNTKTRRKSIKVIVSDEERTLIDEKNNEGKVGEVSSINCNVETALQEFKDVQAKFKMSGNRVAYHIIQSFSTMDNITVEQANEIGKRLCEKLYPNFQCVISTHIDKGHIHNHIAINAMNLDGKKLEDRLANEKEGLYGLSDMSDSIASEYGCYIMPQKTYKLSENKDYYYQYKEQSYREKIREDLELLIPRCDSVDELLEELLIRGYQIRRGKYISVKGLGMKRFARLNTIDDKFSNQNLFKYYKSKNDIKLLSIKTTKTEFNLKLLEKANESKIAIEKSQLSTEGVKYNEYQKTKYQEVKRYYQLKKQLEYLDKYNIYSLDDIEVEIEKKRNIIKSMNIKLKKDKMQIDKIIEITEKAQDYIRLYKTYEYALFYREQDSEYVFPKEVEIFLKLQEELGVNSVKEAKDLITSLRKDRVSINKMKQEILNQQRELNHLDSIKEEKLSNSELFIHNIKFGGKHIDYTNSDDENFCIMLPYTNEKMYIPKKYTAYNERYQFYTLYLVDDKSYEIFDNENNKIGNVLGTELEKYVMNKKKEIDKMYSKSKGLE